MNYGTIQLFASADEGGYVRIFSSLKNCYECSIMPKISWVAHMNAVFDLIWSLDNEWILTASGDLNCGVWDVETQKLLCLFVGHNATVRSISSCPSSKCKHTNTQIVFFSKVLTP